ncbi:YwmB family TATA-box binding protein [Paenibacillus hodogayensis]|uniref:YwmB family TATA-box binding protein n=1 Tax=Paenibacillus hodogayensis TaxID=279208 RepID=A0ABV5VUF7_9BACL
MKQANRLWGILLLGAIVLSGWTAYTGANRAAQGAITDAETMLQAAASIYTAPYSIVLQHSGPFRTAKDDAAFARLGEDVSQQFGLPAAKPMHDPNGHRVYSASGQPAVGADGKLEIGLSGWEDGATNLIVRWDAPAGTGKDKLLAWAGDTVARLEQLGVKAQWMVTLRGGAGALSDEGLKALKTRIADVYKAQPVESYSDSGSEIVSYASKLLHPGVRSGSGRVNLQVALHRDSIYGTYKLTVATPLIVSEP